MLDTFPFLTKIIECRRLLEAGRAWRKQGWFVPVPYFLRRASLLAEARSIGAKVFVETGTYRGDTTRTLSNDFSKIYTIEVQPQLAALAKDRFSRSKHVEVIEGDSTDVLERLCKEIDEPCLFYLDGHDSGGITGVGGKACPVVEELQSIIQHAAFPMKIVIDDARLFGTDPEYPTIAELKAFLGERKPGFDLRVENDAIFIAV